MFDHDRQEWALWVDCLPRTRSLEVKTSATLALERLHLLGFIDDCIRRCMKTPYRYIEEVSALASQHQIEVKQSTLPSPLLFTMLEQFQAKLAGHHIASDAAEVIITYLRQIILSMASKQHDFAVIALLEEKLRACLTAAEVKRETPLPTLTAQSELLRAQIATFGGAANPSPAALSVKDVEGQCSLTACRVNSTDAISLRDKQVRMQRKIFVDESLRWCPEKGAYGTRC
jgi:hypothetical protein